MTTKVFDFQKTLREFFDPYGKDFEVNTADVDDITTKLADYRTELNQLSVKKIKLDGYARLSAENRIYQLSQHIPWLEWMLTTVCEETVIDYQI